MNNSLSEIAFLENSPIKPLSCLSFNHYPPVLLNSDKKSIYPPNETTIQYDFINLSLSSHRILN